MGYATEVMPIERIADEIREILVDDKWFSNVSGATAHRQADPTRGWTEAGFFSFDYEGRRIMVTVEEVKE